MTGPSGSAPLARALLIAGVALAAGCGEDRSPAPRDEPLPLEHVAAPEPLSCLESLRLRIRTCIAAGGPGASAEVQRLCREIVEACDPDDLEARKTLGYTDFQTDVLGRVLEPGEDPVPEAIANRRGYPFLDAVVAWNRTRWLDDPEAVAEARAAIAAMREHARRLEVDPTYRLGDTIRANIAADPVLGAYCYETTWAPPHLVCYASGDRLTDYDLLQVPDWRRRNQLREELRARRKVLEPALAAKARIFAQLNTEFLRRYGKQLGLQPLDAPYGGRPDYEPGVRSYPDGVPMVVWVFESRQAYLDYHVTHRGVSRALRYDHGYFEPSTAWITTYDSTALPEEAERQIRTLLRLGTYQLQYWYARQRNRWGSPDWGQEFFGAGLAGILSGVRVGEDLTLEFTNVDVDLLEAAQRIAASRRAEGQAYPLFPLQRLTSITTYAEATRLGEALLGVGQGAALDLFFQQSWMFVLFLREYEDGRYREAFDRYLDAYMSRGTGFGQAEQVLRRCLGIESTDWPRLDGEFRTYVEEDLLKRELP